jgi:hypothetical protein
VSKSGKKWLKVGITKKLIMHYYKMFNLKRVENNNIMKIKQFIFRSPYIIQGIEVTRKEVNQYGVTEYFYLINNSNLEVLLLNRYDKDFKVRTYEDIKWFLNRYNVAIVNKVYLLNRFIIKDKFSLLYSRGSGVNVLLS